MFGWFKKRYEGDPLFDTFERLEETSQAQRLSEQNALRDVCMAIDVINANMDFLPRGVSPWMIWRPKPRLLLTRRGQAEHETLHGDGYARMEFE